MDALAVAIGVSIGLRNVTHRQVLRLSFHFGLFQGIMPVLGWAAGLYAAQFVAHVGHYIAFALLAFIGARAVVHAFHTTEDAVVKRQDPTQGFSLLFLAVATSMDAFVTGVSFAMMQVNVWYPALVIGVVTCLLTIAGMVFGSRIGNRFGAGIEVIGGAILILIGVKTLLDGMAL